MTKKPGFFSRAMHKSFVRTFSSYMGMIILVLAVIYFLAMNTLWNFYMDDLKTNLSHTAQALSPKVMELYTARDEAGVDKLVKELGKNIEARLTIIKPDGTVIADSEKDPLQMENHSDRREVNKALHGVTDESIRFSSTIREEMLYLAVPIIHQGETRLVIRLSLYLKNISRLMKDMGWKFAAALLVIFLLTMLMTWYFSRGISKPVQEIAAATRKFAAGDFDVKIFLDKKDELSEVANSFNQMVSQQKNLFDKLSENRAELQAIISSMKEGLMVITPEGKITLSNRCFQEYTNKSDIVGKSYWEVFRIPDFEDFVKRAFDTGESFYEEVELDNKTFLVGFDSINRGNQGEKVVTVFMDITGFKQLEKMKKDFVVNLTHELKTPLTAIKGFIETLEDEEDIKNTQYIEIIKRHTDRMNQIVSDMLTLSELEDKYREARFEPLDLREMTTNILKIFREKIKEKKLELEVDIPGDLPLFRGERFKMEQMFVNLVDNAVKYTDEGKISLAIGFIENGSRVKIQVKNTGIPIPEKSLPRIFERFYVVDKSRSRRLGGTGLGLSIVKHVVMLHHGEISAESVEGQGTVFTIILPQYLGQVENRPLPPKS
jgi:two-component system phosphate regulon sensor histidine kinase PhoR